MVKRLNVYDAVNNERLLGTHPRWTSADTHHRYSTMARAVVMSRDFYLMDMSPGTLHYVSDRFGNAPMADIMSYGAIELRRVTLTSKDGWDAEVALVTHNPLEHLLRLKDFWLPGEDADRALNRSFYY